METRTFSGVNEKCITFHLSTLHNYTTKAIKHITVSDKIDAALEMYYIRMGRTDYKNIKYVHWNKGKFKAFGMKMSIIHQILMMN